MATGRRLVTQKLTSLTVNGRKHNLRIEPNRTLAEVLREELGLTGTKVGCDRGTCGACTVLLDGRPVLSCMTLAVECHDKEISTIEGLAREGELHPLQQAVHDHSGFQCGYCTPGMIMAGKALLGDNPHPTEGEVNEALGGHICRCGAFYSFVESVLKAAERGDE